jgi:prefoldin subunit 5
MTDEKKPNKSVDELIEKFKGLVSQADAIRKQMKELTREIEIHTGRAIGMKSSHEIDVPDEK